VQRRWLEQHTPRDPVSRVKSEALWKQAARHAFLEVTPHWTRRALKKDKWKADDTALEGPREVIEEEQFARRRGSPMWRRGRIPPP
jgi:hypothetical protein